MTTVLDRTEGQLKVHWNAFNKDLLKLAKLGVDPSSIASRFVAGQAVGQLIGSVPEYALRHRGGRVPIVGLGQTNTKGSTFWFSYQEEWRALHGRSFRFQSANLTFFQANRDSAKIQLFRAEWPGYADWGTGELQWQAPGAGHPHWQFDALEEYVSVAAREAEVQRIATLLRSDEVEEFSADDVPIVNELAYGDAVDLSWTAMHFAARAKWTDNPWNSDKVVVQGHAHAPTDLQDIRFWATSVIAYTRQEVAR